MRVRAWWHIHHMGGIAMALATVCAAVPVRAQASIALVPEPLVCTITSFVVQTQLPVGALPGADTTYFANGNGQCSGVGVRGTVTLSAAGVTALPPTCAEFVSVETPVVNGMVTVLGSSYPASISIAGPTVATAVTVVTTPLLSWGTGAAIVSITSASLLTCVESGTTQLVFSGVGVMTT